MKKAWIENSTVRDICPGDPATHYHPDVAVYYVGEVGDEVRNGATLVDGVWVNPEIPPAIAPPPAVPTSVTMRQARLALLGAGLLDSIDAAIAGMTGTAGRAAQIEWEYASEVGRDSALVTGMGAALAMSEAQLDALFVAAAAL